MGCAGGALKPEVGNEVAATRRGRVAWETSRRGDTVPTTPRQGDTALHVHSSPAHTRLSMRIGSSTTVGVPTLTRAHIIN